MLFIAASIWRLIHINPTFPTYIPIQQPNFIIRAMPGISTHVPHTVVLKNSAQYIRIVTAEKTFCMREFLKQKISLQT